MKTFAQFLFLCLATCVTYAQLSLPPSGGNQKAQIRQYIGTLAYVEIVYNSPGVKSREGKIWGGLVPWGLVQNNFGSASEMPWRAGANENTSFYFSHDVRIAGQYLPAGKYGFHLIPTESANWTAIFSRDNASWGSYFYDARNDALRVELGPKMSNESIEWLNYTCTDRQETGCTMELQWEKLRLPIPIELIDNHQIYMVKLKEELSSSPGFQWQSFVNAANYCVQVDKDLSQALDWSESAINAPFIGQENFTTLSTKAAVLAKMGKQELANQAMDKAIHHPTAQSFQIHAYGRQLVTQGLKEKALEVFQYNFETNKGAWPTTVGMMRGLSGVGKYKEALKFAELALDQAPDQLNKDNLIGLIEKLKKGEGVN